MPDVTAPSQPRLSRHHYATPAGLSRRYSATPEATSLLGVSRGQRDTPLFQRTVNRRAFGQDDG